MCGLVFVQLLTFVSFICVITVTPGSLHLSIICLYCMGEDLRSEIQWFSGVLNAKFCLRCPMQWVLMM